MKPTLIILLFFLNFNSILALAAQNHYLCEYQLREKISLQILNNVNSVKVIYSSRLLNSPVLLNVTDFDNNELSLKIWGDLTSPWLAGSSFYINLKHADHSAQIDYYGPTGESASVPMFCRPL